MKTNNIKCIQHTMKESSGSGSYLLLLRDSLEQLKKNILKHMTAIHKNIYFDVLDDIVNK